MKGHFTLPEKFACGLQGYLFQIHRSVDRTLHGVWQGLVAYYVGRPNPLEVSAALTSKAIESPLAWFSSSRIRAREIQLVHEVLAEFSALLSRPGSPDPRQRLDLRTRVGEAFNTRALRRWSNTSTGLHEHYQDNPWQIPLPPSSYAGELWLNEALANADRGEVKLHNLPELVARGCWLELYGLRRALDWARSYLVMRNGRTCSEPEVEKWGLAEGWPLLAEHYADPRRFERLRERLAAFGADAEGLSQPFQLFEGLLRLGRTPSPDELAEVHSTFEPAMNLLEVDGRRTALAWRARVRSFDDLEGKEISEILGADWP